MSDALHGNIRPYILKGRLLDNKFATAKRLQEEARARREMRKHLLVPVLDIPPVWNTYLDGEHFMYELHVYGISVKGLDPWDYEGWLSGRLLPSRTNPNRFVESSTA